MNDAIRSEYGGEKRGKYVLAALSQDPLIEHDIETCGMCFHRFLMGEVAKDMLASGDTTNAISRWDKEVLRRWQAGKFYQLWQAERAAGRKPNVAFTERGWEP